jgi:2-hydroxy-6-oxonona-2,4-dienedioate hydrolase
MLRRWTMVGDEVIHSRETPDANRGTRPTIVVLPGVGTTNRYTRPLLESLEGSLPASAVELPGIGSSSSVAIPLDIAAQSDVVASWLRTTGRWPAIVVGNSMGAQTGVELAIRHPELVEQLVLIGPTVDAEARNPFRQAGRLLVDATVERPSLVLLTITDSFLTRRRAVFRYARAALAHHLEDRIGLVQVPVTIVRGELDPLVPRRWVRRLTELAPQGRSVEVAGGGHACHHGRPDAVAELLLQLVASHHPSAAHPRHILDRITRPPT